MGASTVKSVLQRHALVACCFVAVIGIFTSVAAYVPIVWPRATVTIKGLHLVEDVEAQAVRSMIPSDDQFARPNHVGVLAPEGVLEGTSEWDRSPFVTVEDGQITVRYIDEKDYRLMVYAGYLNPTAQDQTRRPWMMVSTRNAVGAECDFVIESVPNEETWTLLEVVAFSPKLIYFKASGENGEEVLVAAKHSIHVPKQDSGPRRAVPVSQR